MASRITRAIPVAILAFIVYIIFTGSATHFDIVTGIIGAIIIGAVFGSIVVTNVHKFTQVWRYFWGLAYALHYFFVAEVLAHYDVTKRILNPKMPINPGIVKVPIDVSSDYSILAVANSITNTPGTVVVYVHPSKKYFYVNWIDVTTPEPEGARKAISYIFEIFARKVFD
jgi:multicomponent Na+:H+ antiporter subunit E